MTEPRYQAGDIIGETTTGGGRLVEVLHVGQEAYFVRHLGGLGSFDGMLDAEPLETAWAFAGCEAVTYLHEAWHAERDRYRLAWLSARSRATYYRELNAVHVEALTDSRRRAADLAQAVLDGTPREELVELITGSRARGVRLAVVRDAAGPSSAELGESLGFAMAAMQPGAEPVFCHHENAHHGSYETHQAGWGRKTVRTVFCPTCKARAESTEGEPVLAPTVLNAERCTQACTERHTNGPGCLMAPDWTGGQR